MAKIIVEDRIDFDNAEILNKTLIENYSKDSIKSIEKKYENFEVVFNKSYDEKITFLLPENFCQMSVNKDHVSIMLNSAGCYFIVPKTENQIFFASIAKFKITLK